MLEQPLLSQRYAQGERNFSRLDLRGSDLSNLYLVGANFSASDLTGAKIDNTDLSDCNFTNTILSQASLKKCICRGVTFLRTNLRNANLEGADCCGARVEGIMCRHTYLYGVIFDNQRVDYAFYVPKGEYNLDKLLLEFQTQRNRLRSAILLLFLGVIFVFLKYISWRFPVQTL
jgi:uncharacterized protein YjbI with pentapeptide repeats